MIPNVLLSYRIFASSEHSQINTWLILRPFSDHVHINILCDPMFLLSLDILRCVFLTDLIKVPFFWKDPISVSKIIFFDL